MPLFQANHTSFVSSKYCLTWNYLVHLFTYYFSSSYLWNGSYIGARTLVLSRISTELRIDSGTQYIFAQWLIYPYNQTQFFWPLFHNSSFPKFFATQSHFANFPETPCLLAFPTTSLLLGLCTHRSLYLGHSFLRQPRGFSPHFIQVSSETAPYYSHYYFIFLFGDY